MLQLFGLLLATAGSLPDGIVLGRREMRVFDGRVGEPAYPKLPYHGGPVQNVPHIYVVFWGWKKYGDPFGAQPVLNSFLQGVGGSAWLSTVTQYYDKAGFIQNDDGEYLKSYDDETDPVPAQPTDKQIQAEAEVLVRKFGLDPNASYVVATPHGHNTAGFGTKFCGYHEALTYEKNVIDFTNLPYVPDVGVHCGAGFVNKPGLLDGLTIVEGHELAETQTDPIPPRGWWGSSGELGDICAWAKTTSDQPFSTGSFPVQPLWSDAANACTLTGPNGP